MTLLRLALEGFALFATAYFLVLNAIYLLGTAVAWWVVVRHLRAREHMAIEEAFASPLTPPISLLLPAFNEEAGVVESVKSLLGLRYPQVEIIVVNDGSTDDTLGRLVEAYELQPVRKVLRTGLVTADVVGTYTSRRIPELVVIDKRNGGKADALNCGINAARYPYVCAIDADAVLEEDALLRVAQPIFGDPDMVAATGGVVRIVNGCTVDHGRVLAVRLPTSRIATMQVVEYLRAFLVARVAWSSVNGLLIISGAFGLFRRSLVEAVGGYALKTVGEDAELVVRLHAYLRDRGEPYRIAFVPDPVCWTEAPEDLGTLSRQRRRWHRGLVETLWRHRRLAGNPRFGVVGMAAIPYFVVFELVGPLLQVVGYPLVIGGFLLGAFGSQLLLLFLGVSLLLGMLVSFAALALEEFNFRRHHRHRDVLRMLAYAILENLGYRQLNDLWRVLAIVDVARGKTEWGVMHRRGLGAREPG